MSYNIAIASGKGGTGKTTVSVSLFQTLRKELGGDVVLVDCDVEEPNDALFFANAKLLHNNEIKQRIPIIHTDKCTFCRKCVEYCEFNAVVVMPSVEFAEVNASLCHSCGACLVACQFDAITETEQLIGQVNHYDTGLIEGKLTVGSAMQTMLVKELKKHIPANKLLVLLDAPPGTSCQVVETVSDADYVILVTEPTPFGLHDLKLMVQLLREIGKPFGVVVNKSGLGNEEVYQFLDDDGIDLLGNIPINKLFASNYAKGDLLNNIPLEIASVVNQFTHKIMLNLGL